MYNLNESLFFLLYLLQFNKDLIFKKTLFKNAVVSRYGEFKSMTAVALKGNVVSAIKETTDLLELLFRTRVLFDGIGQKKDADLESLVPYSQYITALCDKMNVYNLPGDVLNKIPGQLEAELDGLRQEDSTMENNVDPRKEYNDNEEASIDEYPSDFNRNRESSNSQPPRVSSSSLPGR
jgi:hypothetical protein